MHVTRSAIGQPCDGHVCKACGQCTACGARVLPVSEVDENLQVCAACQRVLPRDEPSADLDL